MFKRIQYIDEQILQWIHVQQGNALLDSFMPLIRNPYFWAPLYLFLLVYMYMNFGKKGLWWCAFFFMTFVFCDFISASILKPFVHRLRPCRNPELGFMIRNLVACGSGFSFPSSHATNHFGMAMFMSLTWLKHSIKAQVIAFVWAALICYAQLYVCVHYPSDILCGALLGCCIGAFFSAYYNRRIGGLLLGN